jgi:hypothetical protein
MKNMFKNRVFKHFIYFLILFILTYGFDYFFRPAHKDIIRTASISFGVAAGMYIYSRKKS